jgi:tetratricopeptide (TPR) repeat protein
MRPYREEHMRALAQYVVAALLLCAPIAHAQGVIDMGAMPEQEAKSHFKVGKSLYESGRFAEAAVEWSRAYELSQRVELLYNVYVAYRDASDLPHAIDALRRYLQGAELDDATRVNLQARLRAMEEANAKAPVVAVTPTAPAAQPATTAQPVEPAPAPAAQPAAASPVAAPAPATTANDDGGRSIAPFVLYGVSGALLVAASVTGIVVMGNEKDIEDHCPNDECSDPDTLDKLDSTKTLAVVTDVLWITGVISAGLGTALLLVDSGSGGGEHARASNAPVASLGCGPRACAASLSGRF